MLATGSQKALARRSRLFPWLMAGLALLVGLAVVSLGPRTGVNEGARPPDFTLESLDGSQVSLGDFRGRPVLITFWATWCGPCRVEMPYILATYERYKDQGFVVLAVDIQESRPEVGAFAQEFGLTFPVLLDETGKVTAAYKILGVPTSIFVDRAGIISYIYPGAMTESILAEQLARIL